MYWHTLTQRHTMCLDFPMPQSTCWRRNSVPSQVRFKVSRRLQMVQQQSSWSGYRSASCWPLWCWVSREWLHTYMTLHHCPILRQQSIFCRTLCQSPHIKIRVFSLEFVFPISGFCLASGILAETYDSLLRTDDEVSRDVVEGGFLHADCFVMDGLSSNGLPPFG